jgi:glycosyltransferase involved in cell wall biosynthesis
MHPDPRIPMNVLIVAHGVTDQSLFGGPGRVAAAHANVLVERGHEVTIVTTDAIGKGRRAGSSSFQLLDSRVRVQCIPGRTLKWWPGTLGPVFHPQSKRLLAVEVRKAEVVHCHEWPYHLIQQARGLSHRYGKRCIVQPHGSIQRREGINRLIHEAFLKRYPPRPEDVFVGGSPAEMAEITDVVGPNVRVRQLVNPMSIPSEEDELPAATAKRKAWDFPSDAVVLVYGHRIVPNKGLDLLIRAMKDLPPSVHLAVIGDAGNQRFANECRVLATELGLGQRVSFFPPVRRDEINAIIMAGDIFVLPARRDTFPLMVSHAMACARPVVLTNTCQSLELLGDAVVSAEPTPEGLAESINTLLDPATRQQLGYRGRDLIRQEFGPLAVAERLELIYRGVP